MTERDQFALTALMFAREYLWDGSGDHPPPEQGAYICYAITRAYLAGCITREEKQAGHDLLIAALNPERDRPNYTLTLWLCDNGQADWVNSSTVREHQLLRHHWVDRLIHDLVERRYG